MTVLSGGWREYLLPELIDSPSSSLLHQSPFFDQHSKLLGEFDPRMPPRARVRAPLVRI
jgi:hypothetical protein